MQRVVAVLSGSRAERRSRVGQDSEVVIAERPAGSFSRRLFLGETLDTERVDASYEAGVPRLRIPVAEQAKPRRIAISGGDARKQTSGWTRGTRRAGTRAGDSRPHPPPAVGRHPSEDVMHMHWDAFVSAVQERGEYPAQEEAERSSRVVLGLLGAHLVGEVRAELAARLPETLALVLLNPLQAHEPLSPERFVRATAAWIEGATEKTATWDVSAVLSVVADVAGEELVRRLLLQLPPGYDLLFGRPQPT
jgi:uncharacterized protein (DUF2267 family)